MSLPTIDASGAECQSSAESGPTAVRRMLHEVAQPLTVLAMLLDEAGSRPEQALSGELLKVARGECCRLVHAVRCLQARTSEETSTANTGVEVLR